MWFHVSRLPTSFSSTTTQVSSASQLEASTSWFAFHNLTAAILYKSYFQRREYVIQKGGKCLFVLQLGIVVLKDVVVFLYIALVLWSSCGNISSMTSRVDNGRRCESWYISLWSSLFENTRKLCWIVWPCSVWLWCSYLCHHNLHEWGQTTGTCRRESTCSNRRYMSFYKFNLKWAIFSSE